MVAVTDILGRLVMVMGTTIFVVLVPTVAHVAIVAMVWMRGLQ